MIKERINELEEELEKTRKMLKDEILKREKVEAVLLEKEACLNALTANLHIEFWTADLNFRYTMQNEASIKNVGNVIGKSVNDLDISQETKTICVNNFKRLLKGEAFREVFEMVINNERKSYESIMAPMVVNNDIIGIAGILIDITEHKKVEEALNNINIELKHVNSQLEKKNAELHEYIKFKKEMERKLKEEKKRYRNLLEVIPYGVWVRQGQKTLYANGNAAKIFSLKDAKQLNNPNRIDILIPHLDKEDTFEEKLKEIPANEITALEEYEFISKVNGEILYLEGATIPITFNDEYATLVVFKDIKYRKQLEDKNKELTESLNYEKLRTEFFSNISHEFKTPINIIYNAANMCNSILPNNINYFDNKKVENYFHMIKQNCSRLTKLVNNMLDVNRLEFGNMRLDTGRYNVVDIIESAVNLIVHHRKNKDINIIFDTDEEEIVTVCDANKIERVIFNLLSNAVKFTPSGGEIFVKVFCTEKMINVSVKDTGKGIPEDKITAIFDKFIQVDKSFTRSHEGSGLGLYIVKSIIEMHGGKISVESVWNQGSEFIFSLPIIITDEHVLQFNPSADICSIEFSDI